MSDRFETMCAELNVQISHEKTQKNIYKGTVHGFAFNMKTKMAWIPQQKFDELINGLRLVIKYRYATGAVLESLCGKLMHWAQFRKPAKVLCYRLMNHIFEHIRSNKRLKYKVFFVSELVIRDFRFWIRYSYFFRKVTMDSIINQPSITITGSTDACNTGGGFNVGKMFGYYEFRNTSNKNGINHRTMHINIQEAHAVIMLLYNFRRELSGKQLLLYIDNTSVLFSLFKHWSGSPELMAFIQEAVLLMCSYNIGLRVEFIPTAMNGLADSLSRGELDEFHYLVKQFELDMDQNPTPLVYYSDLNLLYCSEIELNL